MTDDEKIQAARQLADELTADIGAARTREEHIRVTARANSAVALLNGLTHTKETS